MYPSNTRVLVVDDMTAMRIRVNNQLRTMGFDNIQQAGDGKEALALLESNLKNEKPIELILSDWNMPVMSGIDFLVKVRQHDFYGKIPFIMITAEGEKEQVITALRKGVTDYLIKPVEQATLEQKLTSVWQKLNKID